MNNKKVALITGVTGMVGSHLVDFLLDNTDWHIVARRWRSRRDNISHLFDRINKKDRIELINLELNDMNSIFTAVRSTKPDFVFHLAAQSYPQTSFVNIDDTLNTNINGTAKLLEALKLYAKDAIIHVCSSSEVRQGFERKYSNK